MPREHDAFGRLITDCCDFAALPYRPIVAMRLSRRALMLASANISRQVHMRMNWQRIARLLCVLAAATTVSCTSTRATFLDDGVRGYSISCKGYLNNWESCLVK